MVDLIKQAHDEVVTREVLKYELALVEERLATRFEAMERRIDGVEERLGRGIDSVEGRLGRRIDGVEGKVDTLGKDLTIRLGGMLAAAVALVGALVAIF